MAGKSEGLLVTESTRAGKIEIVSENKVLFNISDIQQYKVKFNRICNQYRVIGEFNDPKWIIYEIHNVTRENFRFDSEEGQEFNTALRFYAILLLNEGETPSFVNSQIAVVKRAANLTNGFNYDFFEVFEDHLEQYKQSVSYARAVTLIKFLTFYPINDYDYYIKELSCYKQGDAHSRILPNYKSILLFDQLFNYYFKTHPEERIKYFPLILWWTITRIIPLRPVEFVSLSKNCTNWDEQTNKFYITVPRFKLKFNGMTKETREDTLGITKEVYDLINEYRSLSNLEEEYLLSYEQYLKMYNQGIAKSAKVKRINSEVFWTGQFALLLNKFYTNVIGEYYGYNVIIPNTKKNQNHEQENEQQNNTIQRIRPADTRHFAFCSMMLQGFNPVTIMRIGGHSNIRTQRGYTNHLNTFVDDNVTCLSESIRRLLHQKDNRFMIVNNVFNGREAISNQLLLANKKEKGLPFRKIEDGLCFAENFPQSCPPNVPCILCNQFYLELSDGELILAKTDALYKSLDVALKKDIEFLKVVLTKRQKENDIQTDITLEETSQHISRLIAQKSVITAYRMKAREVAMNE